MNFRAEQSPDFFRSDNYSSAHDTFWQAWSDSQIRDWLINNGYLRSDAQLKRDELVKLANEKYVYYFYCS